MYILGVLKVTQCTCNFQFLDLSMIYKSLNKIYKMNDANIPFRGDRQKRGCLKMIKKSFEETAFFSCLF